MTTIRFVTTFFSALLFITVGFFPLSAKAENQLPPNTPPQPVVGNAESQPGPVSIPSNNEGTFTITNISGNPNGTVTVFTQNQNTGTTVNATNVNSADVQPGDQVEPGVPIGDSPPGQSSTVVSQPGGPDQAFQDLSDQAQDQADDAQNQIQDSEQQPQHNGPDPAYDNAQATGQSILALGGAPPGVIDDCDDGHFEEMERIATQSSKLMESEAAAGMSKPARVENLTCFKKHIGRLFGPIAGIFAPGGLMQACSDIFGDLFMGLLDPLTTLAQEVDMFLSSVVDEALGALSSALDTAVESAVGISSVCGISLGGILNNLTGNTCNTIDHFFAIAECFGFSGFDMPGLGSISIGLFDSCAGAEVASMLGLPSGTQTISIGGGSPGNALFDVQIGVQGNSFDSGFGDDILN